MSLSDSNLSGSFKREKKRFLHRLKIEKKKRNYRVVKERRGSGESLIYTLATVCHRLSACDRCDATAPYFCC